MGVGGDITLSNLKGATGISDDRLSAHHPSGTGNTTKFGDFLVVKVGRDTTSTRYQQSSIVGPNGGSLGFDSALSVPDQNVQGNSGLPFTSNDGELDANGDYEITSDRFENGDKFWVRVDFSGTGDYFREQIGVDQISVKSAFGCSVLQRIDGTDDGHDVVDFEVEVTDYDSLTLTLNFTDGMNTDATLYGTDLRFNSTDVEPSTVYIDSLHAFSDDTGPSTSSGYVGCDGSTQLDNLFGAGVAGDDDYGVKVDLTVNDPKDKEPNMHMWVYFNDSTKSPPDTPNPINNEIAVSSNKTACGNWKEIGILTGNTFTIYVFITRDSSGSTVIDEETIDLLFQNGSANDNFRNNYDEQNQIT